MQKRKITIIVGAGASVPFGMPTGAELRDEILKRPRASGDLLEALKYYVSTARIRCGAGSLYSNFLEGFRDANTASIDSYLSHQTPEINMAGRIVLKKFEKSIRNDFFPPTKFSV